MLGSRPELSLLPAFLPPQESLARASFLSVTGAQAKSHVSSAVPPDGSSSPQNHSNFCNDYMHRGSHPLGAKDT